MSELNYTYLRFNMKFYIKVGCWFTLIKKALSVPSCEVLNSSTRYLLSFFSHLSSRRSSAGSGGSWTRLRMPTTRTRRCWWSGWTVWRRPCSGQVRAASMASRAGRRARPHNSPLPVWFSTTARGRWLTCSTKLYLLFRDADTGQNFVGTSELNRQQQTLSIPQECSFPQTTPPSAPEPGDKHPV